MSFVSHVECTICGHRHDAKRVLSVCEQCGQMLAVRYDLEQVNKHVTKEALRARPPGMYRFRELTPLDEDETPVTLGEGSTPLLALRRLAAHFGLRHVWGKDEGQNPTGSFKARGLGMAITLARARGATGFVIPSAGNAGGAAAVYAARCGLPCAVIVPRGTPPAAIAEAAIAGAKVFTIEGSIATAGKVVAKVAPQIGWFDLSTLKEPYRLEGKKTMGLEQAEGCAPVVKAFHDGADTTAAWENPTTHAAGLRVPSPLAGRQMLKILRDTGGDAVAVSERAIQDAQRLLGRLEGVWTSPEGAALVAALGVLKERRDISADARVVLVLTGAGIKYDPPPLPPAVDLAGSDDDVVAAVRGAL